MKVTIRNICPHPPKVRGQQVACPKKQNSLRQTRQTPVAFLPGSKHLLGKTMSSCRGRGEDPVILVMKLLSGLMKTCPSQPYQPRANHLSFYQLPEFYSDHAQNQLFLGHPRTCSPLCKVMFVSSCSVTLQLPVCGSHGQRSLQ